LLKYAQRLPQLVELLSGNYHPVRVVARENDAVVPAENFHFVVERIPAAEPTS
jgi:hypothetical protein